MSTTIDAVVNFLWGTTRNRQWLYENTGKVQAPYFIDPNTGVSIYESNDILKYLDKTYGA